MKTCFLFVTLLIATTFAIQTQPTNFLSMSQDPSFIDDVLEQIKGTPLGRSVSALIRIKMKTGEADFTRLFEAFDQLKKFLEDQKVSNKAGAQQRKKQNRLVLQNQQAVIDEQGIIMSVGNTKIRQWGNNRHSKQNIFDSNKGTIDQTGTALALVKSTRATAFAAYKSDRARIVQAIEGCRAAVECLNKLKEEKAKAESTPEAPAGGNTVDAPAEVELAPALIQITEQRDALMRHLNDATKQLDQVKYLKKQSRILKSLIKMTQEYTDQSNLDKVIDLINQLKSDLWDKLAALDDAEVKAKTNYASTVKQLQELIDTTSTENTALNTKITNLNTKIDKQQGFVDKATNTHGKATGRHASEVAAYKQFKEDLKADYERIEFELGVLARAESILAMEGITRKEF